MVVYNITWIDYYKYDYLNTKQHVNRGIENNGFKDTNLFYQINQHCLITFQGEAINRIIVTIRSREDLIWIDNVGK